MTDDDPNDWLRAVLKGGAIPPPDEPEPDKPAPSFHGGPRTTVQPEPDPSTAMNAALRAALERRVAHDTLNN